jgi:hypothetical protein
MDSLAFKGFYNPNFAIFVRRENLRFVAIRCVRGTTIFMAAMTIRRAFVSRVVSAFIRAIVMASLRCAGAGLMSGTS